MSAEIVNLADRREPPSRGNGAREALIQSIASDVEVMTGETFEDWADALLIQLWDRGFKVVPLDGTE